MQKILTIALVLLAALLLGAYRDAHATATQRQDTIARLTYRVAALEARATRNEQLDQNAATDAATTARKVNSICFRGQIVYDIRVSTSTFTGVTVTPSYAYC